MSLMKSEVNGRYLHWDDIRRREPPAGWKSEEWWAAIRAARQAATAELPLMDVDKNKFGYVRSESVERLLHEVDRHLGTRIEVESRNLANKEVRDRYILRSLAEEAITSSQLEGASTARKVAKEMLLKGRAPKTLGERMIANNFAAMEYMRTRKAAQLSTEMILELHEILMHGTVKDEAEIGRFRRKDEHIVVHSRDDGETLHIPPPAEQLQKRLKSIVRFANETTSEGFLHPLIRAIALHFAIAYEHPFTDGNGRTARALFYWSLLRADYWMIEFISISRIIQKAPAQYARAFLHTETDNRDLTYFLLHQLDVVRRAIDDLFEYLRSETSQLRHLEKLLPEDVSYNERQREVLATFLQKPGKKLTVSEHQRGHGVVYQTARNDLLELQKAGLLIRQQTGKKFVFSAAKGLAARIRPTKIY